MTYYRWSDDQKRWGPLIYSPQSHLGVGLYFESTSWDEEPINKILLSVFGKIFILLLPNVFRGEQKFGFSVYEDYFYLYYGRNSMFSDRDDRSIGFRIPWKYYEHVRHTYMTLNGYPLLDVRRSSNIADHRAIFETMQKVKAAIPKKVFVFRDFDGEELFATTYIEEREWQVGYKFWKFLRFFMKPKIHRYLDIEFSGEVGPKKGSWKGGTIGHSIEIQWNESPEQAFRRYCEKHNLTFLETLTE